MIDVPETHRQRTERGRFDVIRPADRQRRAVHAAGDPEVDGSWSSHDLGALGVKVSEADVVALAESILGGPVMDAQTDDPWMQAWRKLKVLIKGGASQQKVTAYDPELARDLPDARDPVATRNKPKRWNESYERS